MNLVEQYPSYYIKFNDRAIYEALCEELSLDVMENSILSMQDILKVEKITLFSPTYIDFQEIKLLQNLKTLRLHGCNSVNIDCLSELSNLRELKITEGHFPLTNEFGLFTNLRTLYFRSSGISDLSPLASLNQLENLYLDYNSIEDVSPLCNLTNLKILTLDGNLSLRNINPLASMTNLEFLSLIDINRNKSMKISELREALQENGSNCKVIGSYKNSENIYRAARVISEDSSNG